jgi:hypothetical protein
VRHTTTHLVVVLATTLATNAAAQAPAGSPSASTTASPVATAASAATRDAATRTQEDAPQGDALASVLRSNWRITVDLSGGLVVHDRGNRVLAQNVVGFDTHKVITGPAGDWGTLVMQGYLTRMDHLAGPVDGGDASFMYRIFNLNITRFGRGRFNVRVGHFEIPFGLEHGVNTNGTLRDFMHGDNLGLKADWGAGVNGTWSAGEYEVTWSRGTRPAVPTEQNSYVVAGRVGTPANRNVVLGGSVFAGRVADATGLVDRRRAGVDMTWYRGLYGVMAEVARGRDTYPDLAASRQVLNTLLEVNRGSEDERVFTYVQARLFSEDAGLGWTQRRTGALGLRIVLDNHWSVSGEYARRMPGSADATPAALGLQARYRF